MVHKRHYIWTLLEITIPVLVCALAILSNSHPGKPKLENERTFDADDYERLYGELSPQRHKLLVAPNSSFTRALIEQIDDGAVTVELCNSEAELIELIKREIPVSLDQVKRLLPDENTNVTIGGVVIQTDELILRQKQRLFRNSRQQHQFYNRSSQRSAANFIDPLPSGINGNGHNNNKDTAQEESKFYEVTSKSDGISKIKIPVNFHMSIRAKDFRLGPEPFPKKYSLGPFLHSDHYSSTFFMATQIMMSRAYINLLAQYVNNSTTTPTSGGASAGSGSDGTNSTIVIPTNDDIIGQKIPYPKYVAHKRLKETTLGTFVAGSQKQKPFVLTMDYCITVGFLVTAIFLAKRIVDEKKSRVRDMLRLVGISDWTYYGSHTTNTMIIMLIQCLMITLLFTGHHDAPAQNIDSSLMFIILVIYCISSIMFVITLSTIFNSSTKAIIFTSLLWLGLPEILDRIFKMNSGVIESNGFLAVDEQIHLLFCLIPNFGLRLMNRLLTECDIYGEFYDKKQLYGEYRAIWPNLTNLLPLYKTITIGHIMATMFLSIPLYMSLIYLINSATKSSGGLASLSEQAGGEGEKSSSWCCKSLIGLVSTLIKLTVSIIVVPFKLVNQLLFGSSKSDNSNIDDGDCYQQQQRNLNQSTPNVTLYEANQKKARDFGHLNPGYTKTTAESLDDLAVAHKDSKGKIELINMNLRNYNQQPPCEQLNPCTLNSRSLIEDPNNDPTYFESAPGMLNVGVSIRNLCKTYYTSSAKLRRIDAVRNVSLDMFYSQILVLLGHNGAGKTTLIDIVSGHNQKSSGQVFIDGYNIDTHPSESRKRVGFCPQFDVLFERLTVEEHLYFYGIVKGARGELNDEIQQLLKQSGLDVHSRKLSKNLSGGYKRKLSLAIAMIAKSKVLILDEPTSGMDPESRRKVWDFLQLIRHDRLILMTTHHMEEADALGDRIAVMSGGQVKCCGSALFLKKVFDAGYHLRISKSSNWNQVAFDELIGSKYKLCAKLENLTPHELMYKFDVSETSEVLPALFDDLENAKERVGIFGFGITVSTMDDVFMKIGIHFKDVEAQEMQSKFEMANGLGSHGSGDNNRNKLNGNESVNGKSYQTAKAKATATTDGQSLSLNSPMISCRKERLEGRKLARQHVRALLAKRYHHARKNWFQLLWILSVSLAVVAGIVIMIDLVIFKEELTPEWSREMTLEGAGYGSDTIGVWQFTQPPIAEDFESLRDAAFPVDSSSTTAAPETSTSGSSTTTSSSVAPETSTATIGQPEEPTSPMTPVASAASSSRSSTTATPSRADIRRRRRTRRQEPNTATPSATSIGSQLIEGPNAKNDSAMFLDKFWLNEAQRSGMKELLTYTDINTQMIDLLTRQFADFREHYVIGGEKSGKKYIAWYNGEASHSFPISMNIMLNSILKQFTDLIQDNGHPLKGSRISLRHDAMAQINTLIAFLPHLGRLINIVFLPFSLAFITSYFVIFPLHERVTKVSNRLISLDL